MPPKQSSAGEFAIGQEELASISRDHNFTTLQQYGGASLPRNLFCYPTLYINEFSYSFVSLHQVKGLGELLKTSLEKGIPGSDDDLLKRKTAYGSNTYPRKKPRSFWVQFVTDCEFLQLLYVKLA